MYIIILFLLYIILSHINLIKFRKFKIKNDELKIKYDDFKIKYDDLKIKYDDLKIKYDSKQWVNGFVSPNVSGMIAGYYTNSTKYKK